jgi:hypothetical protein
MLHDALILVGMVAADALILAVWWFLGSRLVPAESSPPQRIRPPNPHRCCTRC